MATQKKTPYYLIIEITSDVTRNDILPIYQIRGLYTTQVKATAELFKICTRLLDAGAEFVYEHDPNPIPSISGIIHSATRNGETSILGSIPYENKIFELQIRTITPDICTLITT